MNLKGKSIHFLTFSGVLKGYEMKATDESVNFMDLITILVTYSIPVSCPSRLIVFFSFQ